MFAALWTLIKTENMHTNLTTSMHVICASIYIFEFIISNLGNFVMYAIQYNATLFVLHLFASQGHLFA